MYDSCNPRLHSMGFSRQEYWSGLPFPSSGDLLNPGIELRSPAFRQILYQLSYKGSLTICNYLFAYLFTIVLVHLAM